MRLPQKQQSRYLPSSSFSSFLFRPAFAPIETPPNHSSIFLLFNRPVSFSGVSLALLLVSFRWLYIIQSHLRSSRVTYDLPESLKFRVTLETYYIYSRFWSITPAMAPSTTPTSSLSHAGVDASQTSIQPTPSSQPDRPLRREGATFFLSASEQALENAMMRSSPAPESVLGKRTRRADDPTDGNDTEPDNGSPSTTQLQSLPSISNVAAMASRYALRKKLRPEQREEVDAFLLVSTSLTYLLCL